MDPNTGKQFSGTGKLDGSSTEKHISAEISTLMREYFTLIDNFFEECVGFRAETSSAENFNQIVAQNRSYLISRAEIARKAYEKYSVQIISFFRKNLHFLYNSGEGLAGLKAVVGGTSRFPIAAFDGIRKFALYADTIFIPDPLLPWIEVERTDERFPHLQVLAECFILLKLKPLVMADLPYPALVIFPSWEKSLEEHDESTRLGIEKLWLDFFSGYLRNKFEDQTELYAYLTKNKEDFFELVIKENLFIAPGDSLGNSLKESLESYRSYIKQQRSKTFNEAMQSLPDELLLANGIMERVGPQFHVRENADLLGAQPLFWLPVHYHYFNLCSKISNRQLAEKKLLLPESHTILQSLQNPSLSWLGNIPINDLAHLRLENQNHEFREQLRTYFDTLHNSKMADLDKVARDVGRGIQAMLLEHDKKSKEIAEKYYQKHLGNLALSVITAGAIMNPWLSPFLGGEGVIPILAKTAIDLYGEKRENENLSRSLVGILSSASKLQG